MIKNQVKYQYPDYVDRTPAQIYQNAKNNVPVDESKFVYRLDKQQNKFVPREKNELTEQQKEFIRVRQAALKNRNNLNGVNRIFLI